jgi:hypothetical protein
MYSRERAAQYSVASRWSGSHVGLAPGPCYDTIAVT